mgnify:FL=1
MNCHAFCERQGEQMLFHQRGSHNGTYLIDHRQVKKIALNGTVSRLRSFIRIGIHPAGMLLFLPMRPTRTSIFPMRIGLRYMTWNRTC